MRSACIPENATRAILSLLALLVAAVGPPVAPSVAWADELRVLRSEPTVLELQWTMDAPQLESVATVAGLARRPNFEGALFLGDPGQPDVPSTLDLVGVPGRQSPRIEVVSVLTDRFPLPDAAAAPRQVTGEAEDGGSGLRDVRSARIEAAPGIRPGVWAEFLGVSRVRGQWLDRLAIHPVRWDATTGSMIWARSLRLRIHFDEGAAPARSAPRREAAPWERMMEGTVLNEDVARGWREPAADRVLSRGGPADSFDSSPNWIRFPITQTGVYRLDYFTFANHGVDPAGVDPRTIRVFSGSNRPLNVDLRDANPAFMTECALKDLGDGDAVFDLEDRFLFWAHGPGGWASEYDTDRSRFDYVENQHGGETYYWVTWEGTFAAPPRRMNTRSVADTTGGATEWFSSTPHRVHFEQNNTEGFAYRDEDGWMWEDLRGRGDNRAYPVSVSRPASGDGFVVARLCSHEATGRARRRVELKLDSDVVTYWEWNHGANSALYDVTGCFEGLLQSGTNNIVVNADFDDETSIDHIYTTWFDVEYDRSLTAQGGAFLHFFTDVTAPTLPVAPSGSDPCTALPVSMEYGRSAFRLIGFDAAVNDIHLFDVTDQHDVVDLTEFTVQNVAPPHNLRFSDPGSTGVRWYAAVTMEGVRSLPSGQLVTPRGLRNPANEASYVIIYHPEFEATARRLADLQSARSTNIPLIVSLEDIYREFSWGMKDPVAIRDFLAATQGWNTAPIFAAFVGDATYDTRPYLSGSPPDYFPTYTLRYRENSVQYRGTENVDFYSTDDFFAYLDPEDYDPALPPGLDIAIGRLPVANRGDADILLEKMEDYYAGSMPGQWQNRVLLVADDERILSVSVREPFHTEQVEALSQTWLPPALDRVKVYLVEYPRNEFGRKPEAQEAFISEFTRGALMTTYTGHGDQNTMAQEEVFVSQKVAELLNEERYTIFSTFSCTVSKFDLLSGQCMTELMIFLEGGGAVTTFSSGGLVYPDQSKRLNQRWLSVMYGTPYLIHTFARSSRELGLAAVAAKNVLAVTGTGQRKNNERYVLLGDPALEVRFGNHLVEFETATVESQATEGLLRVVRGYISDDDGHVLDGTAGTTPFNGKAYVHVTEDSDDSGYDFLYEPVGSNPPLEGHIDYVLDGSTAYRGEVPVTNGRFEVKFYLNEGVQTGNNGRVSVFALEQGGTVRDASGAHEALALAPTISPSQVNDSEGPRVVIRFEGYPNFVDGDLIFTGKPVLSIEVEDPSGINLRPFPQFARLEADVDDRERIDLAEDFAYQEGSFTRGAVRRILPLPPGRHTVRVKAFDNVANRGEAEVAFTVVLPTDDFDLVDRYVAAYPNPFRDRVDLLYRLTHDAEVELKIFTITGRKLLERTVSGVMGDNSIAWDGRDENGSQLANGTYLYKLEAKSVGQGEDASAASDEFVGKVVRMR